MNPHHSNASSESSADSGSSSAQPTVSNQPVEPTPQTPGGFTTQSNEASPLDSQASLTSEFHPLADQASDSKNPPVPAHAVDVQSGTSSFKRTPIMFRIPTPVVLLVLFLALAAFGVYLWQSGNQILLRHISISLSVAVLITVVVCLLFMLLKHKDNLIQLINGKSCLESRYYRYRHDVVYKIRVSLFCSLVMNVLFVCMKTASGLIYHSAWFLTLASYYFLLALIRSILLLYLQKPEEEDSPLMEWQRYRWVGAVLLVMNHLLTGMTGYMVTNQNAFVYPGVLLYGMAIYTAYALCSATYNLFRYRKYGAPILSAAKIVSLTAALVSFLALESASVTAFGSYFKTHHTEWTAATGSFVCALVLFLSLYMLVHSTRKIYKIKQQGRIEDSFRQIS